MTLQLPTANSHSSSLYSLHLRPRPKLLMVSNDEATHRQLQWALGQDFEVCLAGDLRRAVEVLSTEHPSVTTLDLGLPAHAADVEEGFHALSDILQHAGGAKVVIITGHLEQEYARAAIGRGAYDIFYKPVAIDELRVVLRRAAYTYHLEQEYRDRQRRTQHSTLGEMLGASAKMQEVFAGLRKVAISEAPLLIVGETGTGKELAARAIHRLSPRKEGPFVVINCGAIPENLLESELFGHEKGAFTGAHLQRKGRIESAQGGTLLLDEIGELSLPLQVKLLRFLQDHGLERIGGRQSITVDVRVIAATNADLNQAVQNGRFREDLYYRLGVVTIALPPLRERKEDILLLAEVLLRRYAAESRRRLASFSRAASTALQTYHWPGNVRELENRIKRAVIMADGPAVQPEDLDLSRPSDLRQAFSLRAAREAVERDLIQQALVRQHGNLSRVAADLGVSRPTLYELLEKLGIKRNACKGVGLPRNLGGEET